jgi:hypothetical protein
MQPTESTPYLEALDRLSRPITGGKAELAKLRSFIISDPTVLDDPRALQHVFAEMLNGVDLNWPWLEQWRERFAFLQAWPKLWGGPEPSVSFLLCNSMVAGRRREIKFGFVLFSRPLTDEPPAIVELLNAKIDAYAGGDASVGLPPYFPGDRTRASASLEGLKLRKPDRLIFPFLGYGEHY